MEYYHGDEQVELSRTEQKLLRVLVDNRGISLTRERLLERIWSSEAEFVDEMICSFSCAVLLAEISDARRYAASWLSRAEWIISEGSDGGGPGGDSLF